VESRTSLSSVSQRGLREAGNKQNKRFGISTHTKEAKEGTGKFAKTLVSMKGGGEFQYRCRAAIVVHRAEAKTKYEGTTSTIRLTLSLLKDIGIRDAKLKVTVRETNSVLQDPETGQQFSQRSTRFCWDEASVAMMLAPDEHGLPDHWKGIIKDITGLHLTKNSKGKTIFLAKPLGITEEDDIRTATPVMDRLYDSPSVLNKLRAQLGITEGLVIRPGDNYQELMRAARQVAIRRRALLASEEETVYIRRGEIADT
jgi:hypothetical protein